MTTPLTLLQQILQFGSRSYRRNFFGEQAAQGRKAELSPLMYGYGGRADTWISNDSYVITNPWGSRADLQVSNRSGEFLEGFKRVATLQAGQSIDLRSGKFNDPTMHAATAARKNDEVNQRKAQEAGLTQAGRDTSRGASVLASLDEQYWGSAYTQNKTSAALSQVAQANQSGMSSGPNRTVLGLTEKEKAPVKITPPVAGRR